MPTDTQTVPSWADVLVMHFKSIRSKDGRPVRIGDVLAEVRSGLYEPRIERHRKLLALAVQERDADRRSQLEESARREKLMLPAIMVSGTTSDGTHKEASFAAHSGLIQMDVDDLPSLEAAEELRDRFRSDPYTGAAFVSPGGRGVKFIVRIPPLSAAHSGLWRAVADYFGQTYGVTVDQSPKNPCSLCFCSSDPGLWWKDAEEFPVSTPAQAGSNPWEVTRSYTLRGVAGGNPEEHQASPLTPAAQGGTHTHTHPSSVNENVNENENVTVAENVNETVTMTVTTSPDDVDADVLVAGLTSHGEFRKSHPELATVVDLLLSQHLPLKVGARNAALTKEVCPLLFGAMSRSSAVVVMRHLLKANQLGGYPAPEAWEKFHAAWQALEKSWPEGLPPVEQRVYFKLDEQFRDAFRIFRSLANLDTNKKYPPPKFFLTGRDLKARLDCSLRTAQNILRDFVRGGVLEQLSRGVPGSSGRAAEFAWQCGPSAANRANAA